jgi:uncharacterized protein (UPF0548 family)
LNGGFQASVPSGFAHDRSRTRLGAGQAVFHAAIEGFNRWAMFDLGWVRVANPRALLTTGQIVLVEARTLSLWTVNASRIIEAANTPVSFGFLYATTELHVELGEERFLIRFDPLTGDVWYDLEAVSRPQATLARLGFPLSRAFQHKFARESHRAMREAVRSAPK